MSPELILEQLARVLASPSFCNSKRYTRFLKLIVEQTLLGHSDQLKERFLGIEVFDRPADYDLATDSIVRVAAGEVRKRLAQYYVENAHCNELRIQLQPGSYVPEFAYPSAPTRPHDVAVAILSPECALDAPSPSRPSKAQFIFGGVVLAASVATIIALFAYIYSRPTPTELFWKPFLNANNPPIICLGNVDNGMQFLSPAGTTALAASARSGDVFSAGDVQAMNRISRMLDQGERQVVTMNSASATLADLRRQPVILVGGSTNQWTLKAMQLLRYQLVLNILPGVNGIRDRNEQSRVAWTVDFNLPLSKVPKTYAIIARFNDPTTGQPTVIIDGLGAAGTAAGADFLSTPAYFKDFVDRAPRHWEEKNLEVIIETPLIGGDYGPPHVLATYYW